MCGKIQLAFVTPHDAFVLNRMGLEALVESYAFWRPSLRTLTFEDIPGIPKQGNKCLFILSKQK